VTSLRYVWSVRIVNTMDNPGVDRFNNWLIILNVNKLWTTVLM